MFALGPTRNNMRALLAHSEGEVIITYHNGDTLRGTLVAVVDDAIVVHTALGPELVAAIGIRSIREKLQ